MNPTDRRDHITDLARRIARTRGLQRGIVAEQLREAIEGAAADARRLPAGEVQVEPYPDDVQRVLREAAPGTSLPGLMRPAPRGITPWR